MSDKTTASSVFTGASSMSIGIGDGAIGTQSNVYTVAGDGATVHQEIRGYGNVTSGTGNVTIKGVSLKGNNQTIRVDDTGVHINKVPDTKPYEYNDCVVQVCQYGVFVNNFPVKPEPTEDSQESILENIKEWLSKHQPPFVDGPMYDAIKHYQSNIYSWAWSSMVDEVINASTARYDDEFLGMIQNLIIAAKKADAKRKYLNQEKERVDREAVIKDLLSIAPSLSRDIGMAYVQVVCIAKREGEKPIPNQERIDKAIRIAEELVATLS